MSKSNLQAAMRIVDAETDEAARANISDEGNRLLAEAEAAHRAELAQEAELNALNETEMAFEAAAAEAAAKSAETHADAVRVVIRAKAREGHDLAAMRPADALAIDIIRRALDGVRSVSNVRIDDVFKATSSQAEIAKGAAVAKLIHS